MHFRARTLIAVALLVPLAGACDDGTGPVLDSVDAADIESAVDALTTPLRDILGPSAALGDAYPTLLELGVVFDRPEAATVAPLAHLAAGLPVIARGVEIPTELQGQTFVFDPDLQEWVADPDRTGAPAAGIRIIWYLTDPAGNRLQPLEERGFVDLTDADEGDLSQLGVRMVVTGGTEDVVLADLTEGFRTSGDDVNWSEHFEAEGFYGGETRVDFSLTSDASGNHDSGDQDFAFRIDLEDAETAYDLEIDGSVDGAAGTEDRTVTAGAVVDGLRTELALDLSLDGGGAQAGTGTLSHDGEVVSQVTVDGSDFQYDDPDGDELSFALANGIDNLVRTLFLTGVTVLTTLPLLFS